MFICSDVIDLFCKIKNDNL